MLRHCVLVLLLAWAGWAQRSCTSGRECQSGRCCVNDGTAQCCPAADQNSGVYYSPGYYPEFSYTWLWVGIVVSVIVSILISLCLCLLCNGPCMGRRSVLRGRNRNPYEYEESWGPGQPYGPGAILVTGLPGWFWGDGFWPGRRRRNSPVIQEQRSSVYSTSSSSPPPPHPPPPPQTAVPMESVQAPPRRHSRSPNRVRFEDEKASNYAALQHL